MSADDCWLEQGGQRFPMLAMRPNGLALSVTPVDGIQAATVYLAHGHPEDFRDKPLAGRIAVFDFDCDSAWIEAFANGAAAVIFVGPCQGDGHKWIPAHAPMPRFYVDAPVARAGLLTGQTVRLFSRSRFVPLEGRNIFAFIVAPSSLRFWRLIMSIRHVRAIPLRVAALKSANIAGLIGAAAATLIPPGRRSDLLFDNVRAGRATLVVRAPCLGDNDTGSLDRMIAECRRASCFIQARRWRIPLG